MSFQDLYLQCNVLITFREKAGESVANNNVLNGADDEVEDAPDKPKVSAFAALGVEDTGAEPEEEEDFGGLMVCTNHVLVRYNVVDLLCERSRHSRPQRIRRKIRRTRRRKRQTWTTMCTKMSQLPNQYSQKVPSRLQPKI